MGEFKRRIGMSRWFTCLANEEAVGEVNVLLYHALVNSPEFDGWIRKKF